MKGSRNRDHSSDTAISMRIHFLAMDECTYVGLNLEFWITNPTIQLNSDCRELKMIDGCESDIGDFEDKRSSLIPSGVY